MPAMLFLCALDVLRSESMISQGQRLQFSQSLESSHSKNYFLSSVFPAELLNAKRSPLGQELQL